MQIKQMGEKLARSVSDFFHDAENLHTLRTLKTLGLQITNPDFEGKDTGKEKKPLKGQTIVITGTLQIPREEVEERIESLGGHASSAVSKNTDYVIVGENPGSKLQKARSLRVKIISYDEFLKLIEHNRSGEPRSNKLF